MENAFNYAAFYEKWESFCKSKENDEEYNKLLEESKLSFNDFSLLLSLNMKFIEDITFSWEDLIAQASLIYSKSDWKVYCSNVLEMQNYMPDVEDTTNEKSIKLILEGITKLYQFNPKIETLLSNIGVKDTDKFIKILSSTDTEEKKHQLIKEELNCIETIDYKLFNTILIFVILTLRKPRSSVKDSNFGKLDSETQLMVSLVMFRAFSFFIQENYSDYLEWKNQCLIGDKINYIYADINTSEGWMMKWLYIFYNIMENRKNYINGSFDVIHSYFFTNRRKSAIVQFLSKDRYASYVQGLYNDYCEQNKIPLGSRFFFSDNVKAFLPDIVNNHTGTIKTEIESKGENIVTIDISSYRLKKPKNYNAAKLGELYEKMEGFLSGGKFNFVFLFGCNNNYTDSKPINWHGTAPELKFFIKSLYRDDQSPDWIKVSYIFSKKFKPVTLSNGHEKENILITKAIESCKS